MAKPTFNMLRAVYPRHAMPRAALYAELGFEALTNEKQYENTCGIRISYALTKAGDPLRRGGLRINKGPFRGKRIEPSMRNLAKYLEQVWGKPEKYPSAEAEAKAPTQPRSARRGTSIWCGLNPMGFTRAMGPATSSCGTRCGSGHLTDEERVMGIGGNTVGGWNLATNRPAI